MRRRTALLLLPLVVAGSWRPAAADATTGLSAADRTVIRGIVEQQLAAFQRDDGAAAFGLASPTIRSKFRTAEHFMSMVRTAYAPVYRPREVEFRDLVDYRGQPTQRVLLVGPDGVPVVAWYMMQRQPDGSWRINGCVLMGADEIVT